MPCGRRSPDSPQQPQVAGAGGRLSCCSPRPPVADGGPAPHRSAPGGPATTRRRPPPREEDEAERTRLIALVELARKGDADAFGLLYDHYQPSVYRFLYYRTRSQQLAEDLTSETFFRALR